MTIDEVREKYLEFFEKKGHKIIPPAPLVNEDSKKVGTMFTPFGMQQMVPYLLGEKHPLGTKLVDSQPCIRVEDIEEVGDNRHTTFFEMLGNWSLGDYFKEKQLEWFFQFLTDKEKGLGLDPNKLYVSVFDGDENFSIRENGKAKPLMKDEESIEIWKKIFKSVGIDAEEGERIETYPAKKNWWSMNGTPENMPIGGIGGPDSEVFYEFDSIKHDPKFGKDCHPNCDCGRFLEIGNSVFIQYQKVDDKTFEELPNKNVDFGGGLERLVAATNDNPDIFKIDVFSRVISKIEEITGKTYQGNEAQMRVISDHIRAAVFIMNTGIKPGNKYHEYVLRRLIRRATTNAFLIDEDFGRKHIKSLIETIADSYSANFNNQEIQNIENEMSVEVGRFRKTIKNGIKETTKRIEAYKNSEDHATEIEKKIWGQYDTTPDAVRNVFKLPFTPTANASIYAGTVAFDASATYGFPIEDAVNMVSENITASDYATDSLVANYGLQLHREKSRSASAGVFKGGLADNSQEVTRLHTVHHLVLAALQKLIDKNITQKGSNITAERMRMDFNFDRKLTDEEVKSVEELVNKKIDEKLPVAKKIMPREEAEKIGAQMEFAKKYPDKVSIYFIGPVNDPFSKEFCGGPHVANLSEIGGHVRIRKQESASAGVRRVYAVIE